MMNGSVWSVDVKSHVERCAQPTAAVGAATGGKGGFQVNTLGHGLGIWRLRRRAA
jgi:hypothetical protein